MVRILKGDRVLWIVYLSFVLISVLEVFSAASTLSYKSGDFMSPIYGHIGHFVLGSLILWTVHLIPSRWFKLAILLLPISWLMLLAVSLVGQFVNGAARWLFATELCKICTIISVALVLSRMQLEHCAHRFAFKYVLYILAVSTATIFSENLSSALLLVFSVIIMMFAARIPRKQMMWLVGFLAVGAISFVMLAKSLPSSAIEWMSDKPMVHRVGTWMGRVNDYGADDDEKIWDIYGKDAQRIYANAAIRSGGLYGKGFGNSLYREYLPQAYSDFIYAIILEETGLLGGSVVVLLYIVLLVRTYRISSRSPYLFTQLMVMGLVLMLFLQALMNMFVAVGIMPVTGQPLPFLSRGGNSILSSCVILGIILSASQETRKLKQ